MSNRLDEMVDEVRVAMTPHLFAFVPFWIEGEERWCLGVTAQGAPGPSKVIDRNGETLIDFETGDEARASCQDYNTYMGLTRNAVDAIRTGCPAAKVNQPGWQ